MSSAPQQPFKLHDLRRCRNSEERPSSQNQDRIKILLMTMVTVGQPARMNTQLACGLDLHTYSECGWRVSGSNCHSKISTLCNLFGVSNCTPHDLPLRCMLKKKWVQGCRSQDRQVALRTFSFYTCPEESPKMWGEVEFHYRV